MDCQPGMVDAVKRWYLDRRAARVTKRAILLRDTFPALGRWPNHDVIALAAMTLGTSPIIAEMARDRLAARDREALAS